MSTETEYAELVNGQIKAEGTTINVKHDSATNTTTVEFKEGNAAQGQGVTNEMKQEIKDKITENVNNNNISGDTDKDAEEIFNQLVDIPDKNNMKDDLLAEIKKQLTPTSTGTSSSGGGKAKRSKKSAKKGKKSRGMKGKRGRRSAKKGRK